jgi:uncharacterized protein (DUF4415 family)
VEFEWDERKAAANLKKHDVDFADAALVLFDDLALTTRDLGDYGEEVCQPWARSPWPNPGCRLHLARAARQNHFRTGGHSSRAKAVREQEMKKEYDFSGAVRGPVLTPPPSKTRITIRIDNDILRWFRDQVHAAGGGNYQSQMNSALREFIQRQNHGLQDALRAVIRQELGRYDVKKAPVVRARSNIQLTRSARGKPAHGPRS